MRRVAIAELVLFLHCAHRDVVAETEIARQRWVESRDPGFTMGI